MQFDIPNVLPLHTLWLSAIVQVVKADKLDAVIQQVNDESGRLWFVRAETTVPVGMLQFQFTQNEAKFGILDRNEREKTVVVKYSEGVDGFLETLQKFLAAGLIASPKAKAA